MSTSIAIAIAFAIIIIVWLVWSSRKESHHLDDLHITSKTKKKQE